MKSQRIEKGVMLRVWGLLIGVFLLGGVVGISLDAIYRTHQNASQPATSMRNAEAYFTNLKRDLDLSNEQAESLRVILDETREEYRGVCADVRPRYDALRER